MEQENAALRKQLAAATKPGADSDPFADALDGFSDGDEASPAADEEAPKNPFDMIMGMAKNPEFKKIMQEQQAVMAEQAVEVEYRMLVDWFDLKGEDIDTFKALLLKREMIGQDIGLEMMGGDDSGEGGGFDMAKMTGMAEKMQEKRTAIEEEIKNFLTPEAYDEYDQYQQTRYARNQVADMDRVFNNARVPLSEEQNSALVDIIHGIQTDPEELNEDRIAEMKAMQEDPDGAAGMLNDQLETRRENTTRILTAAAEVLDERQFVELEAHYERELKQEEINMRMAEQFMPALFGGGKASISVEVAE